MSSSPDPDRPRGATRNPFSDLPDFDVVVGELMPRTKSIPLPEEGTGVKDADPSPS